MLPNNVFTQSLWGDEGFSAILSMKSSLWDVIKTVAHDTSPPLWNIVEWGAFKTFGASEIVVRSLSLFFFLVTAFFVYLIAKRYWNQKTVVFATLLTILNPFFFKYAFEGRMYSIMAAGVAGSMYFFLRLIKGHPEVKAKGKKLKKKKAALAGYVFFTLWALYSHHFAIFAVITQGIWFLIELILKNKRAKTVFKGFLFVALGYVPWVYPLYLQTSKVAGGFWLSTPSAVDLKNLIVEYLATSGKYSPFTIFQSVTLYNIALWIVIAVLILRKWEKNFKTSFFILLWFLVPILAAWGISQKFTSIFYNRYLLYTIPAAMILLSSDRRKYSNYLIYALIAIFAFTDWHYFTNPTKIPFRDLAAYVKKTEPKNVLIINEDAGNHKLWESKFYGIPAPIYVPNGEKLPYFVGTALMEKTDIINSIPEDVNNLGVITYKEGSLLKFDGFMTTTEKRFGDLNFVWMKREN